MHHTKDCIVTNAEHYALRDITRPVTDHYRGEGWTTAVAIVRERCESAKQNMLICPDDPYLRGRYFSFQDLLMELEERGKP